ncbi:hypothetical protein BpHYR1_041950 [Brachionus plicatilis]|uniref:Uncharacterized protein n=1 Tax=Brachionus plicatilis TaxID=10195 RepID=A0A3M7PT06_BRAPC|nr:hypothetical protein BpHYR1_041950 [Brachionus plicatilis]
MSRRIYRSQYLEDYDDDEYQVVVKNRPRTKYVYTGDMSDQYYVNSEVPQYTYLDDEEEYPEEKIIYTSRRRRSPERMYLVENNYDDFTPEEFEEKYLSPRVYVPPKAKNQQKSRSMEYLPPKESIFTARARNSLHSNILNQKFKKPNHRKEIEEPKIRDKPTYNKPRCEFSFCTALLLEALMTSCMIINNLKCLKHMTGHKSLIRVQNLIKKENVN